MTEYQAVMLRTTRHPREDEEQLTDLLNERSRSGWRLERLAHADDRLTLVFSRDSVGG
jgi:hypothetical protein